VEFSIDLHFKNKSWKKSVDKVYETVSVCRVWKLFKQPTKRIMRITGEKSISQKRSAFNTSKWNELLCI